MQITETALSIPPYVSTTWKNISALRVREAGGIFTLIIDLVQGAVQTVEVPGLSKGKIDEIFEAHARSTVEHSAPKIYNPLEGPFSFSLPLKSGGPIDTLGPSMQHNPEQAALPPLPPEVLKKIAMIARAFGLDDASSLSQAEAHCNCIYCQIARSLQNEQPLAAQVEEVSDDDLKFQNWVIAQTGDQLYIVTNRLDASEQYSVFLGSPLGCTCGSKTCEHIRAVLNS